MTLATLADVESEIKGLPNQTNALSTEVINGKAYLLEALHFVDGRIRFFKHEEYAPRRQVRYFDAPPYIVLDPNLRCVILDRPLVDILSVQFADTVLTQWTPDQSFATRATTDFYLTPIGRTPYRLLYPTERYQTWTPTSQYGSSSSQQVIKIDGLWCYRTYYDTDAWEDSEQTVRNNPLSVSDRVLQVTDTRLFSPGMWLRFNDALVTADCEIAEIASIETPTSMTLLRSGAAARGTTVTAHDQDCEIDVFHPEPVAVRCAQRWAAYLYFRRNVYEQLKVTMGASGSVSQFFPQDIPEECKGILADLPVFGTYTIGSMDRDG